MYNINDVILNLTIFIQVGLAVGDLDASLRVFEGPFKHI